MANTSFEYDYSGSETAAEKLTQLSSYLDGIKKTTPTTSNGAGPTYDEILELLGAIDTIHNSFKQLITNTTEFINNSQQYFQTNDSKNAQETSTSVEEN